MEYDEERNTTHKNIFTHSVGEVWQLTASPTDNLLLSTCYNRICEYTPKYHKQACTHARIAVPAQMYTGILCAPNSYICTIVYLGLYCG